MNCPTCGRIHPRCKSHKKDTGGPCMASPETGYSYCKAHGGRLPSVRMADEKRHAEAELSAALVTYGLRRDVTPQQALLEEVQWTSGHVQWLREQVQALEAEQVHVGPQQLTTVEGRAAGGRVDTTTTTGGARIHVLLDLYQRERKHLVEVSAVAMKLGLEERQVRLAEDQGALVAGVIRRILGDLMLSPEQSALVGEVVPRRLRELLVDPAAV